MRIAFSGDQHIEAAHLTTPEEQKLALEALIDKTIGGGAKTIVLLGDATHTRRPGPVALALWGEFFRTCDENGIRAIALKGNHEGEGVTSLFALFRGHVEAVTEPRIVTLVSPTVKKLDATTYVGDVDLACLPWLPDALVRATAAGAMSKEEVAHRLTAAAGDILRGFVAKKRPGVPLILATHATIAGAKTSTGFDMGYIPRTDYIIETVDLIGFDAIFAGHIHKRQAIPLEYVFGRGAAIAAYTGSLLPLDFSETEPKGFDVYDTETKLVDFVEVPTPRIETFDITSGDEAYELCAEPSVAPGWKVRVRMHVDEATAREFPPHHIEAALRAQGATLVQVELTVERPERERGIIVERMPSGALGDYLATRTDLDPAARLRIDGAATEVLSAEQAQHPPQGDVYLRAIDVEDFLGVRRGTIEFDDVALASLTGPVGSGKSTIGVDAIRYALFGESRIGAKLADRLVRGAAETAKVAVTLEGSTGRYIVARKTKRTARGASTSLDVLELMGTFPETAAPDIAGGVAWHPLSTGKIADGEAHIARILGGLDDETLCVANLVVQRSADSFTRARPEERKRLIAAAAGLQVYEHLTTTTIALRADAERAYEKIEARADGLRARVEDLAGVETEAKDLEGRAAECEREAAKLEAETAQLRTAFDEALQTANRYDARQREAREFMDQIEACIREVSEWRHKHNVAAAIVATKAELLRAREDLVVARAREGELEAKLVEAQATNDLVHERRLEVSRAQAALVRLTAAREEAARAAAREVERAEADEKRLTNTEGCPVVADIRSGAIPPCVFLKDATVSVARLDELAANLATFSEVSQAEVEVIDRIGAIEKTIPAAVDVTMTREQLRPARERVAELERQTGVAEKIAAAETMLGVSAAAMEKLEEQREDLALKRLRTLEEVVLLGDNPRAAADGAQAKWREAEGAARGAHVLARRLAGEAAEVRGKLAAIRETKVDLDRAEAELRTSALRVAALVELVQAWRACRVMVLEGSVIPGVEEQANDILRRFPYGLQIALRTQRETRTGAQAETLDIEVLGGRGGLYELCSGGERTTIDTALHIAIALIVARRSSTRLRFMVVDEPEGLDEPGRMAFAAVMRWVHETHRITVIAMSHMPDLVDALGGERIVAVPGDDGSEVRAA